MSLTALVKARLKDTVPVLVDRIQGAAEMAQLLGSGSTPNAPVAAFVVPLGLQPAEADTSANMYTQMVGENIGILLVVRSYSPTHEKAEVTIDDLITEVMDAVLGWGPDDAVGVATLVAGEMQNIGTSGLLSYLLTIQIQDQLRISR